MFIGFIKKYRSLILIFFIFSLGILNHLNVKYSINRITQPILVPVANNNFILCFHSTGNTRAANGINNAR